MKDNPAIALIVALIGAVGAVTAALIISLVPKCSGTTQKHADVSSNLQLTTPFPSNLPTATKTIVSDLSANEPIDSPASNQSPLPSASTSSLSATTVIILPMRNVSPEPRIGEQYLEYGEDRVRTKLVSLGMTNVADREDFRAIESELQYLTETPNSSQHSVLSSAVEQASRYGARWLIIPTLSVDVLRIKRDAYPGRADIANVTVRVTLYVVDILSSTYKGVAESEQKSEAEYASTEGVAVKSETIRKTIDSACGTSANEVSKKYFRKK